MTIPTRDELIERVNAAMGGASTEKRVEFVLDIRNRVVDLLAAEIRRAVREELEALRRRLGAVTMQDDYTRAAMAAVLDARLADADLWEGACGVAWSLEFGTPTEHQMNYCPRCGAKLETQQPKESQ